MTHSLKTKIFILFFGFSQMENANIQNIFKTVFTLYNERIYWILTNKTIQKTWYYLLIKWLSNVQDIYDTLESLNSLFKNFFFFFCQLWKHLFHDQYILLGAKESKLQWLIQLSIWIYEVNKLNCFSNKNILLCFYHNHSLATFVNILESQILIMHFTNKYW